MECEAHHLSFFNNSMGRFPEVGLRSGKGAMPLIGLGTAAYPFASGDTTRLAILDAIRLGYSHFDAAALYQSEQPLGEAIAEALRLGLIDSRDELFITSKLWCSDAHAHRVQLALHQTLENLGLGYVDLFLIHPFNKEEMVPMDFKAVWQSMEICQKEGLTKAIGVSNFSCKKLRELLSVAKIPPAVNQVELNPIWQQKKLREFCASKEIVVCAYSPLGGNGTPWGTSNVLDSAVLKGIAHARGKSIAQVALRWLQEQGVPTIVKSFNKERLKENIEIFDWSLSEEELKMIDQIPQHRGFPALEFVSDSGPFKTVEELWDGEI